MKEPGALRRKSGGTLLGLARFIFNLVMFFVGLVLTYRTLQWQWPQDLPFKIKEKVDYFKSIRIDAAWKEAVSWLCWDSFTHPSNISAECARGHVNAFMSLFTRPHCLSATGLTCKDTDDDFFDDRLLVAVDSTHIGALWMIIDVEG